MKHRPERASLLCVLACWAVACSSDPETPIAPTDADPSFEDTAVDSTVADTLTPEVAIDSTSDDAIADAAADTETVDARDGAVDTTIDTGLVASDATGADTALDATSDTIPADSADASPALNVVFTTSTVHNGNLGGVAGADAVCQARASAAGLTGTFRAWLSTTTVNAKTRLGTARGFVRVDGRPFADTVADIVGGKILNPLDLTELGMRVDSAVWTATAGDGTKIGASTCSDWVSTSGSNLEAGRTDGGPVYWTYRWRLACNEAARLYCFQIDKTTPLVYARTAGKIAFVTSGVATGATSMVTSDAMCASEAAAAGLSGTFRTLRSTSTASAASRFPSTSTFVRPDGVVVGTMAQIQADGRLLSGMWQSASGAYEAVALVWTGSTSVGAPGTAMTTCNNWSSPSVSSLGKLGESPRTGSSFWDVGPYLTCDSPAHFYCLEQ